MKGEIPIEMVYFVILFLVLIGVTLIIYPGTIDELGDGLITTLKSAISGPKGCTAPGVDTGKPLSFFHESFKQLRSEPGKNAEALLDLYSRMNLCFGVSSEESWLTGEEVSPRDILLESAKESLSTNPDLKTAQRTKNLYLKFEEALGSNAVVPYQTANNYAQCYLTCDPLLTTLQSLLPPKNPTELAYAQVHLQVAENSHCALCYGDRVAAFYPPIEKALEDPTFTNVEPYYRTLCTLAKTAPQKPQKEAACTLLTIGTASTFTSRFCPEIVAICPKTINNNEGEGWI